MEQQNMLRECKGKHALRAAFISIVLICAMFVCVPGAFASEDESASADEVSAQSAGDASAAVWDGTIDVSWYDRDATEFTLTTPAQLAGLAAIVNGCYDGTPTVVGNPIWIRNEAGYNAEYCYGRDSFKGKTIRLGADIDMGGVYDEATGTWSGPLYMPIGGQYLMYTEKGNMQLSASFSGTFDGCGHTVSHIYTLRTTGSFSEEQAVGLIGRLGNHDKDDQSMWAVSPTVKNVRVTGYIKGRRSVGGIVGKMGKSTGGCVISNCVNLATVGSTDSKGAGGIAGSAWNKKYTAQTDSSNSSQNVITNARIVNCYNRGNITCSGAFATGGIVGTGEVLVQNCYTTGLVNAAKDSFAMAVGTANRAEAIFTNCYWLSGVAAGGGIYNDVEASVTNCEERSAAQLKSTEFVSELGMAFVADTAGINDGYPILSWQSDATLQKTASSFSGDTRFDTANKIAGAEESSRTSDDPYEGVIVAAGQKDYFADALSAAGLSGVLDYPIIMVDGSQDSLDNASSQTLSKLASANDGSLDVIIVGGSAVVSTGVEDALAEFDDDSSPVRLFGSDRYATNMAIYDYGCTHGVWNTDVAFVATGAAFPDALSASSYCASVGAPLFMVNPQSDSLATDVTSALSSGYKSALVLGGTSAVSENHYNEVASALGSKTAVSRLGGDTRYETGVLCAQWQLGHGMSMQQAGFATGDNFPDALVSGSYLALTKSVLCLVSPDAAQNEVLYTFLEENGCAATKISFFGGTSAVEDSARTHIKSTLGGTWSTVAY